eukprot:scaffold36147_cov112-Isochrysis_galbana.AAC.1
MPVATPPAVLRTSGTAAASCWSATSRPARPGAARPHDAAAMAAALVQPDRSALNCAGCDTLGGGGDKTTE